MQKETKQKIIGGILLLGLSFGAGFYSKPETVKEVVKYKEAKDTVKIVTKIVYADGTTKEQTIEKDKSTISSESTKIQENRRLGTRLSLSKQFSAGEVYSLGLDSPPLLNLFKMQVGVSASVNTEKEVYGGVYVQF